MRSRKPRSILVMAVVAVLLAACGGSAGSPPTRLTIGSGQEGSTFASYGEAMKAVLGSSLPGYRLVITPSNGSPENVRLLERDPSAIGLVHSGVASDAILGRGEFKQPVPDLRVLANLYTSYIHVVTLPDRNIRSFRDLKGKRVSVGSKGTGTEIDAMQLLAVFGFDPARDLTGLGCRLDGWWPSWSGPARRVRIDACLPSLAALRHTKNVNGSRPAGCEPASCSPSASVKPRSPASSASPARR
jgi:TRAP transporter TAXI family solute receptor